MADFGASFKSGVEDAEDAAKLVRLGAGRGVWLRRGETGGLPPKVRFAKSNFLKEGRKEGLDWTGLHEPTGRHKLAGVP